MKKIIAAILAAATFTGAISLSAFAVGISLDSDNPLRTYMFPAHIFATAMHDRDVIEPEDTLYVPIADGSGWDFGKGIDYSDTDKFTVSAKAIEGAKYVKKISRVSKNDLEIYWAVDAMVMGKETLYGRHDYIKIELKPDYSDTERKLQFEITLKAKSKAAPDYTGTAKGKTAVVYVNNQSVSSDSFVAGQKGKIYKPIKNEENEIVWNDEIRDIARLTFVADSDVAKIYPKLNTKWDNADYAEYFGTQDAFLFDFVSNPYISSTSRAVLEIYDPYYNIDTDEVTVDGADVIIYEVTADGFVDVTDQFTYGENEDGDLVFTTKTRRLGTYIFAEQEVETASADTQTPEVTNPAVKPVPDTGR